jgi:hypothetical protein
MPGVGFEPTIPVFEWVKTFHDSDHMAIVIGNLGISFNKNFMSEICDA